MVHHEPLGLLEGRLATHVRVLRIANLPKRAIAIVVSIDLVRFHLDKEKMCDAMREENPTTLDPPDNKLNNSIGVSDISI